MTGIVEQPGILLELGEHFQAAAARHVDVEQDQAGTGRVRVRAGAPQEFQRLLAVGHDMQPVTDPVVLERLPDNERIGLIVLDEQHVNLGHVRHRLPHRVASGA